MIVFVILHYNDLNITYQAVDSIRENIKKHYHIVVVDNGSPNGTGKLLKKQLTDEHVTVLLTGENLGFAKGNNMGYFFAKNNFKPDFIVVMNNDVMIEQKNFDKILYSNTKLSNYEVIMPDIINKVGQHQNPFRVSALSDVELKRNYQRIKLFLFLYNIPIVNKLWANRKKERKNKTLNQVKFNNYENMVPHGACVIYSNKWIEKENYAFVPDTFLYGEEDILYEYIINRKYRTYYEPELKVKHLEDVATSSIASTDLQKAKFLFKNSFASQKVLKKLRSYNNAREKYLIQETNYEKSIEK